VPLSTVPLHAKALSTDPLGSVSAAVLLPSMELQSCCEAAEAVGTAASRSSCCRSNCCGRSSLWVSCCRARRRCRTS
jgi:hypothetical protein